MARYRDMANVSILGTSLFGVQDIEVNLPAENFVSSGDNKDYVERVDVTKQKVVINVSGIDPLFKRDIKDPMWGDTALNEVLKASMSESCDVIEDSSENDQWITYIGITKRVVEGQVELRDIAQVLDKTKVSVGTKGTFQFKALIGASSSGLADQNTSEEFAIYNAVITGVNTTEKHGDLASGTIDFMGHGDDSPGGHAAKIYSTGSTGPNIHTGDKGTITFIAPSALGGSGGSKAITIANCVCTKVEITAQHAGRLERKYSFEAYSADGQTSPLTIS